MTYALFNIHTPPVELIDGGYQLAPGITIKAGAPIFTADTFEEVEAERKRRVEETGR